jgi:hypothetical protein
MKGCGYGFRARRFAAPRNDEASHASSVVEEQADYL